MKYKAHIPTEEYGFIEVETDDRDDLLDEYQSVKMHFGDKEGWNQLDWARIRNTYITSNVITPDDLEGCSKWQRLVINEVKKTFKSINKE